MKRIGTSTLVGAFAAVALAGFAGAAGEKYAVYGGDTTPAERQELATLFGTDLGANPTVVSTSEMVAALQGTGLNAVATDNSISSSVITCRNAGEGLTVQTQNITRITAPVYASALVTAGVGDGGDGAVMVAAPAANPVTGETALVGVLKAFPQCQSGRQPDPARVTLAYQQVARTVALAGSNGDINKAAAVMLRASGDVVTGRATDDTTIGAALDSAASAEGFAIDPAQRTATVSFLTRLRGLSYGAYGGGYQVVQSSPTEVTLRPTGAAPAGAAATAAPATAAQPTASTAPVITNPQPAQNPALASTSFTGEVQQTGDRLTVRSDGQTREVGFAPAVTVLRDGKAATVADIRSGDTVAVTTNPDGTAQRIEATSADGGGSIWRWLIPLLLAALLLLGLLMLLAKRRRDNFVLQRKDAPPATGT